MSDNKKAGAPAEPSTLVTVDDYKGGVVFNSESAGYKNALGMYTIAADGSVSDVRIVFANASLKDSGGDLVGGKSTVDVAFQSGQSVGFFVLPDGYSQAGMSKLLTDTSGSFKLVDANGKPGNVNGGVELKLVHVAESGAETVVKSAYGTSMFHSVDDGSKGLNGDKLDHVRTSVDVDAGTIRIGFEDLKGGGDKDFDDSVFTVNVGKTNAAAIAAGTAEAQVAEKNAKAENDAKDKADRESKDKADRDKDKAEHDDKDKADRDEKDKAEHDDKDKAARDEKDKADRDDKDKVEHDDKDKVEHDDKEDHADNSDDDKHDGHGDGDHNHGTDDGDDQDDGNGTGTPPVAEKDALVLKTADVLDVVTGEEMSGNSQGNDIVGGHGSDDIRGRAGDDAIHGDRDGLVTVPLTIDVGLTDADSSEQLSILVGNMPAGATLSAGRDNGDGTWSLVAGDLAGLTITAPDAGNFTLKVQASTTGVSNLTATSEINVTMLDGQDDVIQGNSGNDKLVGGAGDDEMYGGSKPTGIVAPHVPTVADNDVLSGGVGNDRMWGNAGDDQLFGEQDNDVMSGGRGNDVVDGGVGNDTLTGNTGDDLLRGGDGDDNLAGNAGNDVLDDGAGNDTVMGSSGDDLVLAGEGDDTYNGGSGFDTIDFSGATQGMTIDLSKKTADGMGHDTLSNFEQVIGSSFDDTMKGSKSAETMVGGAGNDVLRGMGGADTLTGGEGRDTFQWLAKDVVDLSGRHLGADVVTDFGKDDTLDLSKFFSGVDYESIDDVLAIKDDGHSSHIFAAVGENWVEVVTLEGVTGLNAQDMLKDGMLLA